LVGELELGIQGEEAVQRLGEGGVDRDIQDSADDARESFRVDVEHRCAPHMSAQAVAVAVAFAVAVAVALTHMRTCPPRLLLLLLLLLLPLLSCAHVSPSLLPRICLIQSISSVHTIPFDCDPTLFTSLLIIRSRVSTTSRIITTGRVCTITGLVSGIPKRRKSMTRSLLGVN